MFLKSYNVQSRIVLANLLNENTDLEANDSYCLHVLIRIYIRIYEFYK